MARRLPELPGAVPATREALRALACYAISPARKARTGRIGLRSVPGAIATPPFDDGTRIVVRDATLAVEPGDAVPITTLRAAAELLAVELSRDPGVGHDLPPFAPDAPLAVDAGASRVLAGWYAFGDGVLADLAGVSSDVAFSEAQLWPEHFDLAVVAETAGGAVNVGFSGGDRYSDAPYLYVGPHDRDGLEGEPWNAPFGAVVGYDELREATDPARAALTFVTDRLRLVARRSTR